MNALPPDLSHNAKDAPSVRIPRLASCTGSLIFKCVIILSACILGIPNAIGLFFVLPTMVPLEFSDTVKVLNYFTFTACFACLVYYVTDVIRLYLHRKGKDADDLMPPLKHLITVALLTTMVVFIFWVDKSFFSLFAASGADKIAVLDIFLVLLHILLPSLVLIDWLLFDDKGRVGVYTVTVSGIGSILYSAYILTISEFFGGSGITMRYLYRFYDIASLGWKGVILRALGITCVAVACAAAFLLADRMLARKDNKTGGNTARRITEQ